MNAFNSTLFDVLVYNMIFPNLFGRQVGASFNSFRAFGRAHGHALTTHLDLVPSVVLSKSFQLALFLEGGIRPESIDGFFASGSRSWEP